MTIRNLGKILMWFGALGFVGSTAWWYLFFEQLLGENVKEASKCFYKTTAQCEIGNLVGQVGNVLPYDPIALYLAFSVFIVGILVYGLSTSRK